MRYLLLGSILVLTGGVWACWTWFRPAPPLAEGEEFYDDQKPLPEAEAFLRGKPLNEENFSGALEALLAQAKFRTSARRASADYRRHIAGGLFKETLETAWGRAG